MRQSPRPRWAGSPGGAGSRVEHEAFDSLYRSHADQVYGFCLRRTGDPTLAEDARATVFLEAWRRRREVDLTSRPVAPWLFGVARNVLRNQSRAERRQGATQRDLGHLQRRHGEDLSEQLARRQVANALVGSLRELSPSQRQVVGLCLLGERSYEAAAGTLEIPIGTVRSRLSRARLHLEIAVRAADGR
jgi:RNA polymerase sigma-70 factor (ECF subfamily)